MAEEHARSIHLKQLHTRLGDIAYQLTQIQYSHWGGAHTWSPALNAYRCTGHIVICVDLAGVDKQSIRLRAESRRLRVGGQRQAPEPEGAEDKPVQVLAMEIDYGPFEREVVLPVDIEPERVTAQQRNGLLWVYLPLRLPA